MAIVEECQLVIVNKQHCKIILSTLADPYLSKTKIESLEYLINKINSMPEIKVVELVGSDKYFTAGGSLDFLSTLDPNILPIMLAKIPELILGINAITVANMFGHAIGGGLALGLWSDLPCLCENSLYGANFLQLGFTPGMGTTAILENFFGKPLAYEMMLTGAMYKGSLFKKFNCPISCRVYSYDEYEGKVNHLISSLISIDIKPLMLLKQNLIKQSHIELSIAAKQEIDMHKVCFSDPNTIKNIINNYSGS